jgi:decaprenyl-phosphate phosphoribosyltransferase
MKFLKLLRVHQYTKNLFVFAALFFSGNFTNLEKIQEGCIAFICFCIVASSIYILNDLKDVENDKLHPVKKDRPIAKGEVKPIVAIVIMFVLAISGLSIAYFSNHYFFIILLAYFILNLGYCFGLKNISIIDVTIVALGFVLRVVAGGTITNISVSHWLIIMTFLLALFIAFAKRNDDLVIKIKNGLDMRSASKGYSFEYISSVMSILNAVLVVCYIMYITSIEVVERFSNRPIYLSTLFVILGVLRYLQISLVEKNSGSPSLIVLKDLFLQLCILAWILFFTAIIYIK